jgi:hypothetical protein
MDMAWTGQEILEHSYSLINMILEDGTISTDDTAIYSAKASKLLTLGQYDLAKSGDLYGTSEYDNETDPVYNEWKKYTLPSTFSAINEVLFEYGGGKTLLPIRTKLFGKNELYIYFEVEGTARLSYISTPVKITSLSQTLEIDDYSAIKLAWFLAWQFKLSEQDESAPVFEREYKGLKREANPAASTEIVDVYG